MGEFQSYVEPVAEIDGYILTLANGALRIEDPVGETGLVAFDNNGLIKGSYVAETDSVRIETADGSKTFEFPIASLLDLRGSAGQTFLVALRRYSFDYRPQPITVYRTGPVG